MKCLKKNQNCCYSRLVDFVNSLLHPADSMVCLFNDYTPTAVKYALPLGRRSYLAGNPHYMVVDNDGI